MKQYIFLIIFIWILGCTKNQVQTSSSSKQEDSNIVHLKVSMYHLKHELDELMPYIINPKEFHKNVHGDSLKKRIQKLNEISKEVTHEPAIQRQDPVLKFLSQGFQDEINRSYEAFQMGHYEYARINLLSVSAFCIECHTRSQSGPSLSFNTINQTWSQMRPIDQLDYLIATRQFDQARQLALKIIKGGLSASTNVFDLDRAVRLGLLITVRYDQNPTNALELVNTLLESKTLPFYLKSAGLTWKNHINRWNLESASVQKKDPLAQARIIANRYTSSAHADRHFEVEMLRIQALLNPFITNNPSKNELGEALFLLGLSYEVTKDLATWSLHENYYEACIRHVPGSTWSKQCYDALEKNIYLGYTGSRGTFIPPDVEAKLKELKKLTTSK